MAFALSRFVRAKPVDLARRTCFSRLERFDVDHFKAVCSSVITTRAEVEKYNRDWLNAVEGSSACVLRPASTSEVSRILAYCNERSLAVVPQGGNTGLVGGSVPLFDEVVLSMERMRKTISIDPRSGVARFEAGAILEKANEELAEQNLLFPLDLGAKGSCHIGGNISTNAGGLRLLRYGNLHGSVVGLEFVLADGTVVDCLSQNKKDNTGVDLKQLMIGAEGILGVITKAAVHCAPLPGGKNVLLVGVDTYEDCVDLFRAARAELGEILSAFEFFDSRCVRLSAENLSLEPPEFLSGKFGVLIETSGANAEHDQEKLDGFLANAAARSDRLDGSVAAGASQQAAFWAFRERLAEALMHDGFCYKYDVSVPNVEDIYKVVGLTDERMKGVSGIKRIVGYGHMGDGNLHLNVTSAEFSQSIVQALEPWLWETVKGLGGSISAEHGVGSFKAGALHYSKSAEAISMMRALKNLMDPKGILNPYKVLPPEG